MHFVQSVGSRDFRYDVTVIWAGNRAAKKKTTEKPGQIQSHLQGRVNGVGWEWEQGETQGGCQVSAAGTPEWVGPPSTPGTWSWVVPTYRLLPVD